MPPPRAFRKVRQTPSLATFFDLSELEGNRSLSLAFSARFGAWRFSPKLNRQTFQNSHNAWKVEKMPIEDELKRELLAIAIAIVGLVSAAFFQHQGITNTMVAMQSNFAQGRHLDRKRRREEEEERAEHYSTYQNIFVGIVGIIDVTEWITCNTCKWKNLDLEKETYSGKKQDNTITTLAVINKHGYFIYADPLAKGLSYDAQASNINHL